MHRAKETNMSHDNQQPNDQQQRAGSVGDGPSSREPATSSGASPHPGPLPEGEGELQERIFELALSEVAGGARPPDLSEAIMAAMQSQTSLQARSARECVIPAQGASDTDVPSPLQARSASECVIPAPSANNSIPPPVDGQTAAAPGAISIEGDLAMRAASKTTVARPVVRRPVTRYLGLAIAASLLVAVGMAIGRPSFLQRDSIAQQNVDDGAANTSSYYLLDSLTYTGPGGDLDKQIPKGRLAVEHSPSGARTFQDSGERGEFVVSGLGREASNEDFDSLIDLIKSDVAPESWSDNSGQGTISEFETNLALTLSQEGLRERQLSSRTESLPQSPRRFRDETSELGSLATARSDRRLEEATKNDAYSLGIHDAIDSSSVLDLRNREQLRSNQLFSDIDGDPRRAGLRVKGPIVFPDPSWWEAMSERRDLLVRNGRVDEAREVERRIQIVAAEGIGPGSAGDQYHRIAENKFLSVLDNPLSTFSIDVDTASYSNMRRFLREQGTLPPPDSVRIEEFVNYFSYSYAPPEDETPFAAHIEVTAAPWAQSHRLVRVGLQGKVIPDEDRPDTNLVFLVDVSGSMNSDDKLPLLVKGLSMLAEHIRDQDRVAIVVYAGSEGLALPSTPGAEREKIVQALANLQAGGSTNGGAGIELAYKIAQESFITGGVNRVILCTDGDFNVGTTSEAELERMVEARAKEGTFLTVLGFGRGNLNDSMMEKISNIGNGNYYYIDGQRESEKVLVEQMGGTLVTIAKDVKIQIEFNPNQVSAYRLIGYENRMLAAEDFNDDTKDAGEIGAGHSVTALYEIVPAGGDVAAALALPSIDPLKYQRPTELTEAAGRGELLTLKLRYKQPDGDTSSLLEFPVVDEDRPFALASGETKFAAAVAGFGMLLRDSAYRGDATYDAVMEIAGEGIGEDPHGRRTEFVDLVRLAKLHVERIAAEKAAATEAARQQFERELQQLQQQQPPAADQDEAAAPAVDPFGVAPFAAPPAPEAIEDAAETQEEAAEQASPTAGGGIF
jgi:Ca-activated chloride channel family protein